MNDLYGSPTSTTVRDMFGELDQSTQDDLADRLLRLTTIFAPNHGGRVQCT